MMPLVATGRTDVGKKREFNEDAFAVDLSTGLLALADGMGGHAAGEVAARIAIDAVSDYIARTGAGRVDQWPYGFDDRLSIPANRLLSAFRLANEKIFNAIEEREELRGMGTTLVTALAQNTDVCFAHVGDSRAYLCRDGALNQVTNDHSWVNEQVGLGLLSREEASRHPFRNVITRALGSREDVAADITQVSLSPKDTLLLCSDGLTTMLDDNAILNVLMAHSSDPPRAADELIKKANEAGGDDNITVIVAGMS